jgi:NurA-like 5'-3' nuclease
LEYKVGYDREILQFCHATAMDTHSFLRGMCLIDGELIVAGSTWRGSRIGTLLYKSKPRPSDDPGAGCHLLEWNDSRRLFDGPSEVYDILPWRDDIMEKVVKQMEVGL